MFGDDVERISLIDTLTGEIFQDTDTVAIFPASHYVTDREAINRTIRQIENDLDIQLAKFKKENKLVEGQRLQSRT